MMGEGMEQISEREEIEMLVPFYVTGRISTEDARLVEAYLKRNPDFAEHIELARDERAAAVSVNEALGFPSARSSDRVFEAIAREAPPRMAAARAKGRGLLSAVREFFTAPSPQAVRYAAVAAAAVVLMQAAVVVTMLPRTDTTPGFQTASGPKEAAATGVVALIAFQDGATLGDISRALTTADARIVEGPVQGGLYKIRFATGADGEAGAKQRMDALKSSTSIVKSVLPSR